MRTLRTILKFVAIGVAVVILCLVAVRTSSHHSLTVDILGSYFPAWMICIVSGLSLTLVSRWIVRANHLEACASPAPLIYTSLTIIYTFVTWIIFYQN